MNTATSQRGQQATASAGAIFRWLMKPRDLGHPEACDFLAGNPTELAPAEYVQTLQRAAQPDSPEYFRYGPPWRPAIEAVTRALSGRLEMDLDPDDVFLTRGASSGLGVAIHALVDAGDEVLMMSPPWFFYEAVVLSTGALPRKVRLANGGRDLDLPAIERAITERTRMVIINTPHNPTGRIYPEDQLRGLAEILEQASRRHNRRVYLASDEAYARILFGGTRFLTPAHFYPATIMLHTYSKTLLAPSQRAGYMAMPPAMPDREEVRPVLMNATMFNGALPDTLMQRAMPALEEQVIDLKALVRRRDRLVGGLKDAGYDLETPEAGFYVFPRCPIPDSVEFCDWLDDRHVHTLPGEAFEMPGYFRLSLTATDAMVERALPILAEAMRSL